ncbi:hypothetical protein MMC26_004694 [Xylographa opegraphella]|nr:hypothetical protein [Xylographa opegraphella]
MSQTTDPDRFFQTTDSIAETARKAKKSTNKHGSPIKLPSKILAIIPDPTASNRVYVAEAAGTARRVELDTGHKSHIFRGPTTPLTSLAISLLHPTLYAGSWDKTIWSWEIPTRTPGIRFRGHSDFVKCLLTLSLPGVELLISGSSDATIILWDATTGEKLQILKGHSMGVLALAIDPLGEQGNEDDGTEKATGDTLVLFSASSDRTILRWRIDPLSPRCSLATLLPPPLTPHETSIYALHFSPASADLYTASADGTAMRLSREHGWISDTTLQHGDYVRAVAVSTTERYVVTAGRCEDVKVWDAVTGELMGVWWGHWDEVMGLVIVRDRAGKGAERIVSAGIDATIRVWLLDEMEMQKAQVEREREEQGIEQEEEEVVGKEVEGGLTAEEEAELAELMDD